MEPHAHSLPFVHMVLAGIAREDFGPTAGEFAAAQIAFHPSGSRHTTAWKAGSTGFAVEFGAQRTAKLDAWGLLPSGPISVPVGFLSALMAAMRREMDRTDEPVAALAIDSLLLELLAELRRLGGNGGTVSALPDAATAPGKAAPPWLLKAREMVCDTYVAPPELEQIATVVGVHPVSLARAFRRHFGETVGDCVRRRRIEAACQQMVATDAALTHIAFEAGFADQAHFTRTFQRHIGMPPSEYARQFRRSAKLTRAG
jgi:AraC family transcriptional regulator